jgi:adenosylmethionine-8-amino-7-oxononanoate aminotransferase
MERYPFIGDVRGKGLLLAFELVADRATMAPLEPSLNAHARLVERAFEQGLIVYSRRTRGGRAGDHVLVCPPMVVSDAEIEELMAMLILALDAFATELNLPVERG